MEENHIIETWDVFREYIPEKHRETAANQYVDFLLGKDVEVSTLEGLMGYDSHLDHAIELVVNEAKDDSDDYEEDNWDFDDDSED